VTVSFSRRTLLHGINLLVRWEDNFKIDLREMWWEGVGWMHMADDRDL
jgi:hypothetical protein